jgi:hypothetical protein
LLVLVLLPWLAASPFFTWTAAPRITTAGANVFLSNALSASPQSRSTSLPKFCRRFVSDFLTWQDQITPSYFQVIEKKRHSFTGTDYAADTAPT